MNEDELPINAEMASAYLDGELDPDVRALAESDPEVMAMVDSFTRVRGALGEIEPVAGSAKTAAMAAALAEFDARQAARTAVPPAAAMATITPLQSRRMGAYRLLTGLAAAAVIGVVAVAALNSGGSDDKTSSAVEAPANDAAGAVPAAELPSTKIGADTAAPAAPADTAAAAQVDASIESATTAVAVIETRDDLVRYAAGLEAADSAAEPTTTVAVSDGQAPAAGGYAQPSCRTSDQTVLGSILFQGRVAYAVRNTSSGALQAIDAADCHVLLEVEP
jgi:hypothetical protein